MMTETEWFETYGECVEIETDAEIDAALAACCLWAHVEGDDDEDGVPRTYLLAGYHRVNVIRYVRTERSWPNVDVPIVLVHDMP